MRAGAAEAAAVRPKRDIVVIGASAGGVEAHATIAVDAIQPVHEIANEPTMLIRTGEEATAEEEAIPESDLEAGFDVSELREAPGSPSVFRCPECWGSLWELEDDGLSSEEAAAP